jgi:hypothetical protein
MPPQLDRAELAKRFRNQGNDLVVQVASLMQGGILSAAAFSLIEILRTPGDVVVRLMLWLMSVGVAFFIFFRLVQRAPLLVRAGGDVLFMVPVMGLLETMLFAILATNTLGPGGWRYWYVAATLFAAAGFLATWLNLRALERTQYADDAEFVFHAYRATLRRVCVESIVLTGFTGALAVWILAMPSNWPYFVAFVSIHAVIVSITGVFGARGEGHDTDSLRQKLNVWSASDS